MTTPTARMANTAPVPNPSRREKTKSATGWKVSEVEHRREVEALATADAGFEPRPISSAQERKKARTGSISSTSAARSTSSAVYPIGYVRVHGTLASLPG